MKLKNISKLAQQVHDDHAGRGAVVEPGETSFDLSEQAARELLELKSTWEAVESAPVVRTSGQKKGRG